MKRQPTGISVGHRCLKLAIAVGSFNLPHAYCGPTPQQVYWAVLAKWSPWSINADIRYSSAREKLYKALGTVGLEGKWWAVLD